MHAIGGALGPHEIGTQHLLDTCKWKEELGIEGEGGLDAALAAFRAYAREVASRRVDTLRKDLKLTESRLAKL